MNHQIDWLGPPRFLGLMYNKVNIHIVETEKRQGKLLTCSFQLPLWLHTSHHTIHLSIVLTVPQLKQPFLLGNRIPQGRSKAVTKDPQHSQRHLFLWTAHLSKQHPDAQARKLALILGSSHPHLTFHPQPAPLLQAPPALQFPTATHSISTLGTTTGYFSA